MDIIALANERYAVKRFDTAKKIPQNYISALQEVLRLCPSSINIQPWKFCFVQDKAVKSQLAEASLYNKDKVNEADLLIVFCVADDLEAFQKVAETNLPPYLIDWYNQLRATMPEAELKDWMARQVYLAMGFALNNCSILGLGSTPLEGIEPAKYQEILGERAYKPLLGLTVGYPAADDINRPAVKPKQRRPADDVIAEY